MNGVNIQYIESLVVSNNIIMVLCIVAIMLILVVGSVAAACLISDEYYLGGFASIMLMFLLAGVFIYGGGSVDKRPDKNYYVTIDENVDVTQFYDKYDVIKRKGDIWIVRDKITD